MNEEQLDELKVFVHDTVGQSESRLMAHIGGMEKRLYDVEQQSNGLRSQLGSLTSEFRSDLDRIRHEVEQIQSKVSRL